MNFLYAVLEIAPSALPAGEAFSISITGIVVVILMLGLLSILVQLLSKTIRLFEGKSKKTEQQDAAPVATEKATAKLGTPLAENQSAGSLDLNGVDEKTAAVLMAIVSHKSGIPLNRLEFKSIKKIEK